MAVGGGVKIDNATRVEWDRFVKQDDKQSSKGIEFGISTNPLRGLNILLAGCLNEDKYPQAATGKEKTAANAPAGFVNYWNQVTGCRCEKPAGIYSPYAFITRINYIASLHANSGKNWRHLHECPERRNR
ncbi:hypothetical protein KTO58_15515 [Chitinophaga pendula]|uniref:hypothetical protein n=1 Tax=Chitinophaga pendula TaxID=2849666 RepID=UPI001CED7C5A|nr:hypothetical protein [Chitinophaga pendula]UCJ05104.1 hypothetical protein KTO58_15515 [Chitinophaga pendula]